MATKEQVQKILEEIKDDSDRVPLFSQAELEDVLQKRLAKEAAKLGAANDALADLQAKLKSAEGRLGEVEEAAALKGKGDLEKLQHELEKIQRAHQALIAEKEAAEKKAESVAQKRKEDFLRNRVRTLLLKAERFDPKALDDALDLALLRLGPLFEVAETEKGFQERAVDPTTLAEVDAEKLVGKFVQDRPGFQVPRPAGGGSEPATPAPQPAPKSGFENLEPGAAQIGYALRRSLVQPKGNE